MKHLSEAQLRRLHKLRQTTAGVGLAGAAGGLSGKLVGVAGEKYDEREKPKTSKERGLKDVKKAEAHLSEVSKTYMRRTVRDPGSELDILAAANLMLDATHKGSILPWRRRRQLKDQLNLAIARGYLNAPYTTRSI